MADEPPDAPETASVAEPKRVRRRRSSARSSRRSKLVQTAIPLTSLRFAWRSPTKARLVTGLLGVVAVGVAASALIITQRTAAELDQASALLSADTRGAADGQAAADRLAADAQIQAARDTAAAQSEATRDTAAAPGGALQSAAVLSPTPYYSLSPPPSRTDPEAASDTYAPLAPALAPAWGRAPTSPASDDRSSRDMGYTLPSTSSPSSLGAAPN